MTHSSSFEPDMKGMRAKFALLEGESVINPRRSAGAIEVTLLTLHVIR